jgi:hypothetical protein
MKPNTSLQVATLVHFVTSFVQHPAVLETTMTVITSRKGWKLWKHSPRVQPDIKAKVVLIIYGINLGLVHIIDCFSWFRDREIDRREDAQVWGLVAMPDLLVDN